MPRSMMPRIAILIQYFGPWPEWTDFFIESCRANRTIDWIVFGDSPPPENRAPNVRFVATTFADYKAFLAGALGVPVEATDPYKLCDFKPALAYVHRELVGGYDFVGFGDLDVIYGDLRAFFDAETLDRHDILSSHRDRISGHLCLLRNSTEMTTAFRQVRGWQRAMTAAHITAFDEQAFFHLFRNPRRRSLSRPRMAAVPCLFREAYSTPAATHHMRWYWQQGTLTNEYYPNHPMMYLHFMRWHSNRWLASQPGAAAGAPAPWSRLARIVQIDWREARKQGFMIGPEGFRAIEPRPYP